ncbi:MAG: UvrD-helicase domain-containing protein [Deltaproteobacteria bacterium]|nr:UvrD-helicase domain-containing protein [Deltaproteobacteria bacterium]
MNSSILPDEPVRLAAVDIRRSFHLEAPAGSGKTWLLTARFLNLLAEVEHPGNILALTFTNKAAAEMKARLRELLERAGRGAAAANVADGVLLAQAARVCRRHAAQLLAAPDGLQVKTFHSFCLELVQRAPLEAGIPPGSRVMSDEQQRALLREAADETINQLLDLHSTEPRRQAVVNWLLRLNNDSAALQHHVVELLARRDQLEDLLELIGSHRHRASLAEVLQQRLARLVQQRLHACARALAATPLGRNWPAFLGHLHEKGAAAGQLLPAELEIRSWQVLPSWQAAAEVMTTRAGTLRKRLGPATGFYAGFNKSSWAEMLATLPPEIPLLLHGLKDLPLPGTGELDLDSLYDLVLIMGEAVRIYGDLCRQQLLLDYIDLEQGALRIFNRENPADLHLYLDQKIKHLLVDEFQDTSRNQWLLIQYLCAGWPADSHRTLMLVGDPKQSIYGFRNAEVSLFVKAKQGVPVAGMGLFPLESLQLQTNFRSHPLLVDWCNQIFGETIMVHPDPSADEVEFIQAKAISKADAAQLSLAIFSEEQEAAALRKAEAEWLAEMVRSQVQAGDSGGSIGILLFARTPLAVYMAALQQAGVAVQVQEGLLLSEQPEVQHLHQITLALSRPHDDVAWASLLRSPWCYLTLADFVQVAKIAASSWRAKCCAAAAELPAVAELWNAMHKAQQRLGRQELATLVARVWQDLDGPAAVAAASSTAGVANCRRYLELLAEAEKGIAEETIEEMELLLENAYSPVDPAIAAAPVEMMTVHRAKGLEFDTVYLPFLDWDPLSGAAGSGPPYLLERLPEADGESLLALAPDRRQQNDSSVRLFKLLQEISRRKQLAEAKRLFYVAATRAKKRLCLSGICGRGPKGLKPRQRSPLQWLLQHHGITLEADGQLAAANNSVVNLLLNPQTSPSVSPRCPVSTLPQPLYLRTEPLPYSLVKPSELAEMAICEGGEDYARERGVVIHRMLESLGRQQPLPTVEGVAAALVREKVPAARAFDLAQAIVLEVQTCLQEPFFAWLLGESHTRSYCEIPLEDCPGPGKVRAGVIDRLVSDGDEWWLVDYKTGRPAANETVESFLAREVEHYRPQILGYREMAARSLVIDASEIHAILYFTALQRKIEL